MHFSTILAENLVPLGYISSSKSWSTHHDINIHNLKQIALNNSVMTEKN